MGPVGYISTQELSDEVGLSRSRLYQLRANGFIKSPVFTTSDGKLHWNIDVIQEVLEYKSSPPKVKRHKKASKTISKTLREIFNEADRQHWSYTSLSNALETDNKQVGRWRAGLNAPSILTVEDLCAVMGLELRVYNKHGKRVGHK